MQRVWIDGYRAELLPNGFIRCEHQRSGLVDLVTRDGELRSGDSRMEWTTREAIAQAFNR